MMCLMHILSHVVALLVTFASVMDVDYSPTGQEFVAGGFDQSIRIFRANEGHSRCVFIA